MIRTRVIFFTFMLAACFSTASAETYSWTDAQGTVHFTEDLGKVPEKIRNKAKRENGAESAPDEKPAAKDSSVKTPDETPRTVPSGRGDDDGIYAGKTYDQWQKELVDREAAMITVRARIDEIAVLLKDPAINWDEQKKLMIEHNSLSAQFKEMKAQYNKQVEVARKAGLQINIQQ
jgi:Domain of unknown function (DUF4124)